MEVEERTECLTGLDAERRAMPRCVVNEEAVLLLVGHGGWVRCRIVELSLAGCRISTMERLAGSGQRVEAVFKLRGVAFRFIGVAEWTDGQNLVGIRFVDMPTRRRNELVEVLCEVEAEEAGRLEKIAAAELADEKRDAAEEADQEQFAAEIRLAAERRVKNVAQEQAEWKVELKTVGRTRQSNEVHAAATRSDVEPQQAALEFSGQPPALSARPLKRERRQQARHVVDTSAVILLINVGSLLKGRIVDLSLSGCRVRADEKLPVGIYTRVETEFRLGGLPFRLGGVIQAVQDRDRRNVGIRFLDVSARKREQLEQLIEEIEELRVRQAKAGESGLENQGARSIGD
ncbi:MAG: PilZ domain-containing protein [Terracidiphilus sp.]